MTDHKTLSEMAVIDRFNDSLGLNLIAAANIRVLMVQQSFMCDKNF